MAAVMLINNSDKPQDMSFAFAEVPGLLGGSPSAFCLYDVWAGRELVGSRLGGFQAHAVAPHDSVFLKIHQCM